MKKVVSFISILFAIIGMALIGLYVYHVCTYNSITMNITQVSDQLAVDVLKAEDLSDEKKAELEERWFMEANVYSNDAENGGFLSELKFNYFTSWELVENNYRSSGLQYYSKDGKSIEDSVASYPLSERDEKFRSSLPLSYMGININNYDSADGISFSGSAGVVSVSSTFDSSFVPIVKIDDHPYAVELTGSYEGYIPSTIFFGRVGVMKKGQVAYTWEDILRCTTEVALSNSAGYGDYYVTLDLSNFFTLRKWDSETGKFIDFDSTDLLKNYTVLKFHLDENGAMTSKQSMFGQIDCNPSFGITDVSDYWGYDVFYTLSAEDFKVRESALYGGKVLSLSAEAFNFFSALENTPVKVVIDLDELKEVVGFDFDVFKGLKIDRITLLSSTEREFTFLSGALKDTGCTLIQRSAGLTLTFEDDSITNYTEVVL